MQLGDEATGKLGGITREFDSSSEKLVRHGEALDRAAECRAQRHRRCCSTTCPRAEETARAVAEQLRADRQRIRRQRPLHSGSRSASSPSVRARPTRSWPKRPTRLAARLAEIESAERRSRSTRRRGARQAYSGTLDALLDRTSTTPRARSAPGSTSRRPRSPRWSRRLRPASARPAPNRCRIAGSQHRPCQQLARRPVEPGRRAGPRVAADDRRDRPRPRADRPALHRACRQRRRARQPLPRIADPRPDRARHARRPGEHAGRRDRLACRAHGSAAREHRAPDRRNPRGRRHARSAKPRAAPTGWSRAAAAIKPGDRLDARRGGRGQRAARRDRRRRSPSSRTASRRCSRASTTASATPSRSSPSSPRRSSRSSARRATSAPKPARRWSRRWSRSRKPRRTPPSARARRSRRSFRKAPASCPRRRAAALERVDPRERRGAAARGRNRRGPRRRVGPRGVRPADPADADARPERRGARSSISSRPARSSARRTARPSPAASRC